MEEITIVGDKVEEEGGVTMTKGLGMIIIIKGEERSVIGMERGGGMIVMKMRGGKRGGI